MRKVLVLLLLSATTITWAADKVKEVKYRRSSLYTIMVPDEHIDGAAGDIVQNAFLAMPIPDKYNDHNLSERIINIKKIDVSEDEVKAIEATNVKGKSKVGGMFKSLSKGLVGGESSSDDAKKGKLSDAEMVARILKYFEQENVANKLVAKWYGYDGKTNHFNYELIKTRGLQNASQEEMVAAELSKGGKSKIMDNASAELIPQTFVMVTRYSYLSAEEILEIINAAASTGVLGSAIGGYTQLATSVASMALKGYFVKTTSYLFQLSWDKDIQTEFETKYWKAKPADFLNSGNCKLKYVDKTWDYAPATMKLSFKADADAKLINRATVRATDGSILKLQKKYEQFKTSAPLHIDEAGNIFAYIGMKEGVKNGTKFDVFEQTMDKEGKMDYKKVGSIAALKGKVWDNRAGANEKIEGAAEDASEEKTEDSSLQCTYFSGNSKKLMDGMLIRQVK